MKNERMTATLVGVLYIVGTAAGIGSAVIAQGISGTPESLRALSVNANPAMATGLLILVMGIALGLIPALLFPVLKRESESLAVGYVIFRGAIEAVTYIAVAVCWLMLAVVAGQVVDPGAGATQASALGTLFIELQKPILAVQSIVFAVGGLMLYYGTYRLVLVPRWLSVWGFAGCVLYLVGGLIAVFATDPGFLVVPLAIQEMVMAVWLIARGFSASSSAPRAGYRSALPAS